MHSKKTATIFMFCLFHFTHIIFAQSLDPRFAQYDKTLSENPRAVVNELLATPVDQQPQLAAQYHYILSNAYLTLVYPQESLAAANQALELLPEKLPAWLYNRILITKSLAMELNGQANEALPLAQQALSWAAAQSNENFANETMIIDALIAVGYIENTLGNSVAALDALMRAYNMAPLTDAITTKSAIASSVALVYEYRREDKLAIPYFAEAVEYHRRTENLLELSIALYGLGRANKNIGNLELGQDQLQESLDISRAIDDDQGVAYALKELAPLYMHDEGLEQAESMLNEATELFTQSKNQFMLLDLHKTLTQLYLKKKDSHNAQLNIQLAKKYLNEERMPIQAISLAETQAQVNASQGLYQQAYEQLMATVSKKQRLLSARSTQQLHELRAQFEIESQTKENFKLAQVNAEQKLELLKEQQNSQKLMLGIIATASLVLLLIATVIHNRKQQRKLLHLANYDHLTGLPNRSHIMALLKTNYEQLNANHSIHLVMVDLDHFKQINDQLGHDVGDQVLQHIGVLFQQHISDPHMAGRFGGEEFLLAFIDYSAEEVTAKIETLRQQVTSINQMIKVDDNMVCPPISFSAGISNCLSDKPISHCIKTADLAMYEAKNAGRNLTVVA